MCGQAEIDGYGFCLGLKSLQNFYKDRQDLHNLIHSVIYLIRQANFRPTHTPWSDMSFLAIRPLGELLDMFHTHEATKCHDKVYALLGMSSDGLDAVNLLPNYEIKWGEVFRRLIKFLLCGPVYVETKDTTEMAIITSKASILGRVSSVAPCSGWGDTYKVAITSKTTSGCIGYAGEWNACWTLHHSAKSIQQDDIVCLLQGAPSPTIVRVCKGYLAVIMILATHPNDEQTQKGCIRCSELLQSARTSSYELVLVWDWAKFPERLRDREAHEALLETTYLDKVLGLKGLQDQTEIYEKQGKWQPTEELGMRLMKAFRKMLGEEHPSTLITMSNLAFKYMNQGRWKEAEELEEQVVEARTRVLGEEHPSTLTSMSNLALTYMNQRTVEGRRRARKESSREDNEGAWGEASFYADEHEQLGIDVHESRAVEGRRRAREASSRDDNDGAWGGASFYAHEHEQLGINVHESRAVEGRRRAREASSREDNEGARGGAYFYADQHEQLGINVHESRTVEGRRRARRASSRDEKEGAWGEASFYADQHEQLSIDVHEPRTVEGRREVGSASNRDKNKGAWGEASFYAN